jgi:phosphoglycolate phosphatase-like HAD superfamily hydrolase
MRKKLLLFDIDGTLLLTGRAGEHALRVALHDRFGMEDDLSGISFAGSTDGAIVRQMFDANAIPHTPENVADLLDGYAHHLALELPRREGCVLLGIVELLEALHGREDCVLGLLTGNIEKKMEENGVSVQILTEFTSVLSLQHATEPAYRISRRLLPRDGAWQPT